MNFRAWTVIAMTALLTACASGVKLDDVPVEDKAGTNVTGGAGTGGGTAAGGNTTGADRTTVKPVVIDGTNNKPMGPPGVGTVVLFDYDSFVIKSEYQGLIDGHARHLKAAPARRLVVEGHTDERGGREYNLALGQKRAEAVRRALGLLGVTDAQVEAVSFGKEKPVATGTDEASLAQNRRAEIVYK
mgnify:CR=1 FL=1|jgi:peptidoglycan-associated lipoprotein